MRVPRGPRGRGGAALRGAALLAVAAGSIAAGCARAGPDAAAPERPAPAELVRTAEEVVGFLRGQVAFDRLRLADTVVLYLAPEGGGARAAVPRERLRDPAAWSVRDPASGTAYPLAPPPGLGEPATRVGRHFACLEQPLGSRVAELDSLPHVGTTLRPPGAESCLQSWNLTLVFAPGARPPVLVAAVYDQWEW